MESIFIPLSLIAGTLLAVQAGANAQLSKATGSPFAATTLQLAVGALLLLLIAGLTGSLQALASLADVTWWHALGGTASAFYVVATILLLPRLGAVVSVGLFIAGQMLASMVLDTFGLLGMPTSAMHASSALGTLLVLAGAAAIVSGQDSTQQQTPFLRRLSWILFALTAGAVLPVRCCRCGVAGAGRGQRAAAGCPACAVCGSDDQLRRGDTRHGRRAHTHGALWPGDQALIRAIARDAVVGQARRFFRRNLCHHGLYCNAGDRRFCRGRFYRRRPANRIGTG
jgi:uncharacterized membrane protein YdcZ (DUF606 family)